MKHTVALPLLAAQSITLSLALAAGLVAGDEEPRGPDASLAKARALLSAAEYSEAEFELRRIAETQKKVAPPSANYAATLDLLGELHTALADYVQAEDSFRDAAALFKKMPGQSVAYANTLTHWAKAAQLRADYPAAARLINESIAVLAKAKLQKSTDYGKALVVLADLQWARGMRAQARDSYSRAIEIFEANSRSESPECTRAQNNLGLLERSSNSEDAEKRIRAALATRKRLCGEHHPDYAHSLNSLAILLQSQGKSSEAEPLLRQALEIRRETLGEIHPEYASTVNALANLYRERGDYVRAEPEARRAAEICQRALGSRHPYYASALNNLALVYMAEASFADAEGAFSKALGIYDAVLGRTHPFRTALLHNLADLYAAEGDHLRARRLLDEEGQARRDSATRDPREYTSWLVGRARLLHKERKFADAETLLRQTLDWLKKVRGAELDRAVVLEELALLNLATAKLGKDAATKNKGYRAADVQLKQVLEIRRRLLGTVHPDYATALEHQARLYRALDYFADAETRYQIVFELRKKALGASHPGCVAALADLAYTRRAQGKEAAAAADYKQALGIIRKHLSMTATAQTQQQQLAMLHSARQYLDEYLSLMIGRPVPRDELYAEMLAWKGTVSRRQQMLRTMRRAIEEESPEIAGLHQELEAAARQLAQLSHAGPRAGDETAHGHESDLLVEKVDRLQRELAAKSADYRRDVESQTRTPDDLRNALPPDVALVDLLEYWHLPELGNSKPPVKPERRLIAFVVRRGSPTELIELGPANAIERAVKEWIEGIEGSGKKDTGSRLRQLLWTPLESHVSDAETVLISPDGASAWLPWAALPAKEPGKFLIESQSFVMLPVPQMLPDMLASDAASSIEVPTLLVVGDIDYRASPGKAAVASAKRSAMRGHGADFRYTWGRLAATQAEMTQVADSFAQAYPDAPAVLPLRGSDATEEAVRASAPEHRFLHFATHGFFAPPQLVTAARGLTSAGLAPGDRAARSIAASFHPGLLSGIVLAGANHPKTLDEDDGILTALEIEQLGLSDVKLVTLSACQTGIGSTVSGEGLLSLQRAFQVAGANSVLASLWRVDDAQTARLMGSFYDNLWRKKLSRAEALRRAQAEMLNDKVLSGKQRGMEFSTPRQGKIQRLSPFYWAAFVLSGDWR